MKTFLSIDEVRKFPFFAVACLSCGNFEEFLESLEFDSEKISAESIRRLIGNLGVMDDAQSGGYEVVPLDDFNRSTFNGSINSYNDIEWLSDEYYGYMSFYLPLSQDYDNDVSDLKMQLLIKKKSDIFTLEFFDIRL